MTVVWVALGGGLGAALRYVVGISVAFPFGTLVVNIVGSLAIGLIWHTFTVRGMHGWLPFVMTGILGGFTTFSAFSMDTLRLVDAGRLAAAGGYVMASVLLSLAACAAGLWIAKGLT